MDIDFQEFLGKLQKRGSKPHRISHCLGSRDAWKWVRKNKWQAVGGNRYDSSVYCSVIDKVNSLLTEHLLDGHEIELPHQMGSLRLISTPVKLQYVNGVLRNNYRTDWKKTLRYWYETKSKPDRVIKRIQKYICTIQYSKRKARYRNQRYYAFRANRSLVRALGRRIEEGRINTLIC